MQALTPIVAATDFSSAANRAVLRAALIARQQGAELHLLHVTAPLALYPGQEVGPADSATLPAALGEQPKAVARVLRDRYGVPVQVAQRIGRAHSQIADYAAEVDAGLVVVGVPSEVESRMESHIEPGYPPSRILESAADWRAELIVLGRQGRGGLEDFLLGSVSKDVAQAADCDVLLVA